MYKSPKVKFNEEAHLYSEEESGELLVGVTTVLQQMAKDFLAPWAVKEMSLYLNDKWDIKKRYTQLEKGKIIDEGKKQWRVKSEQAKIDGTLAHEWIEQHIAGKNPAMPDNPKACNAINAFLKWEEAKKPKWLYNEIVVANLQEGFKYAGKLDFIAEWDGKTYLGDFKTSSQIGEDYHLQTAAYQYALKQCGMKVDGRFLLRLDKETAEYEEYYVFTPYKFDLEVFACLYNTHKWRQYYKNRTPAKEWKIKRYKLK